MLIRVIAGYLYSGIKIFPCWKASGSSAPFYNFYFLTFYFKPIASWRTSPMKIPKFNGCLYYISLKGDSSSSSAFIGTFENYISTKLSAISKLPKWFTSPKEKFRKGWASMKLNCMVAPSYFSRSSGSEILLKKFGSWSPSFIFLI